MTMGGSNLTWSFSTLHQDPHMTDLIYAGVMPESRTRFPAHTHAHWEIVCYVEGSGTLTIGKQHIPFVPGTIVAQPPHIAHYEVSSRGYRCLFVGLRGPRTQGHLAVCEDDAHGSFRTTTELLVRECWQKAPGWEAAGEDLVRLLWRLIMRWSSGGDDLVRQAEALFLQHLGDSALRIATLAQRLNVHDELLRRRFVAVTGRSPRAHLTRLRIEAASHLLAHGSTVTDAATACGFSDPFHFSKVYHQATGRAPKNVTRISPQG